MKSALVPVAVLALLLTGCSASDASDGSDGPVTPPAPAQTSQPPAETQEPVEPLDLTGSWKMTNSQSEDSYQEATITADRIVINWVNEVDSLTALYWAGSYVPPTEDVEVYTWDSVNDTAQTETAIMASDAPTKTFTYNNGVLSYELTALGTTMTVEMQRQ